MGDNLSTYLTEQYITFDPIQEEVQGIELQENNADDVDKIRVYSDFFLLVDQNINKQSKDYSSYFLEKTINQFFKSLYEEKDYLDSEGIEPPNNESIGLFLFFLDKLAKKNIFPDKVSTSAEEGICLKFVNFPQNLYFEIYNDGQLGYIVEDFHKRFIVENADLENINFAIKKIQEFLDTDYEIPQTLTTI